MYLTLYNCIWYVCSPALKFYLSHSSKYKELVNRFRVPDLGVVNPLWIHACSVGEVNLLDPILRKWLERYHDAIPLLITTSTINGYNFAIRKYQGNPTISVRWCPFDHPKVVEKFVRYVSPQALCLVETELWPNLILVSKKYKIPILVINGRLSDKYFKSYLRWRKIYKKLIENIDIITVQNEIYRQRFLELGGTEDRIFITGNVKYDSVQTEVDITIRMRLKRELGIPESAHIIVFGSLREGDELVAKKIWDTLSKYEKFWFILAPRHPEYAEKVLKTFESEKILLRSENIKGREGQGERIIVVDTIGELVHFYSIGLLAIIGGSWFPGVGGHNPLEPAGVGVLPIFGPYMSNFQEPSDKLLERKGAIQVEEWRNLPNVIENFLIRPEETINYGTRAREVVLKNRGATEKIVELIGSVL